MHFHILTLFPEVLEPYFRESILGIAQEKGLISVCCHDLRSYAKDKHHKVDDAPYGGGAGMVFKPDVLVGAVRDLKKKYGIDLVILTSPRGELFRQETARSLTRFRNILLICGRYEGVDERAIDLVVDREISIGDYVISGGELAAAVIVEAVSRLVCGVVGNEEGPVDESHTAGLLEYPHYTRPQVFEGRPVPDVLLSGNHAEIEKWRREESLKITKKNRPDL